jgi:hypothetical protein
MKEQVLLDEAIFENNLNLDDQIVDYVVNILKDDTADEAMEGFRIIDFFVHSLFPAIPPLLQTSGLELKRAEQITHDLLVGVGKLKKGEELKSNQVPQKMEKPVVIKETKVVDDHLPTAANHGNTYGFVNIDKKPVDEEDYKVTLQQFMEETNNEDPLKRRIALRDLCPC